MLHPRLGSLCLGRDFGSPFETDPIITSNLEVNFDETKKMYTDQEKSSFTLYCRGAGYRGAQRLCGVLLRSKDLPTRLVSIVISAPEMLAASRSCMYAFCQYKCLTLDVDVHSDSEFEHVPGRPACSFYSRLPQ